jgi:hypothetical protein
MDAIMMLAPDTDFPEELEKKIASAGKLIESTSALNPDAYALLMDAYKMINNRPVYFMPHNVESSAEVLEHSLEQAQAAREYIQDSHTEEGIKILLDIVILHVIPLETS